MRKCKGVTTINEAQVRDLDLPCTLPIPVRPLGLLINNNHRITVTHHISEHPPHTHRAVSLPVILNIKVAPTTQLLGRRGPMMIRTRTMKMRDLSPVGRSPYLLLPIPEPGPISRLQRLLLLRPRTLARKASLPLPGDQTTLLGPLYLGPEITIDHDLLSSNCCVFVYALLSCKFVFILTCALTRSLNNLRCTLSVLLLCTTVKC